MKDRIPTNLFLMIEDINDKDDLKQQILIPNRLETQVVDYFYSLFI